MLIPDWAQINAFPTPLEPGERSVIEAFEQSAANLRNKNGIELSIYVQPYLENYRPDVVLAIANCGLVIVEVKDWKPGSSKHSLQAKAAKQQVEQYRDVIIDLCSQDLYQLIWEQPELREYETIITDLLYRSVQVVIAVPFLNAQQARSLFPSGTLITSDTLRIPASLPRPSLSTLRDVPDGLRQSVFDLLSRSLASWLVPPFHRAEQGSLSTTELTRAQKPHAVSRGAGWYRLRGPAGSGKSLVLAHKAAHMAAENKRVLVICYNVTLRFYLRDLIARMRFSFAWDNIVIRHFHGLLREVRLAYGVSFTREEIESTPTEDFLANRYPALVADILDKHDDQMFKFDGVLIDEGQDMAVNWFQVLARCLTPGGELLLVRDALQNIFGKDIAWTDNEGMAIRGLRGVRGFSGPWAELTTTWRMSPTITTAVSQFAQRVLDATPFTTDARRTQPELFGGATFCRWENLDDNSLDTRLVDVVAEVTRSISPTHPSDFAILTHSNDKAWHIVEHLRGHGYRPVHVYDPQGKRDRKKMFRFRKGDGRIKVCTGHSFKGYELWGIILVITPRSDLDAQALWVYTSMGRAIEGLWVLNTDPNLNEVGTWFPSE